MSAENGCGVVSLAQSLSEHHRHCDQLIASTRAAAVVGDWQVYEQHLASASKALDQHMTFEEDELFPALERTTIPHNGMTAVMRAEHSEIRVLLAVLDAAVPRLDPEGCRDELEHLCRLLERHNATEESVLYPICEQLGAGTELLEGAQALASTAARRRSHELDVRGLEPPESLLRIIKCLARAPRGPLRVLIQYEQRPLFDALSMQGFSYLARTMEEGGFEILIEPPGH